MRTELILKRKNNNSKTPRMIPRALNIPLLMSVALGEFNVIYGFCFLKIGIIFDLAIL